MPRPHATGSYELSTHLTNVENVSAATTMTVACSCGGGGGLSSYIGISRAALHVTGLQVQDQSNKMYGAEIRRLILLGGRFLFRLSLLAFSAPDVILS